MVSCIRLTASGESHPTGTTQGLAIKRYRLSKMCKWLYLKWNKLQYSAQWKAIGLVSRHWTNSSDQPTESRHRYLRVQQLGEKERMESQEGVPIVFNGPSARSNKIDSPNNIEIAA